MRPRTSSIALALVVALATSLRFARLRWGLDDGLWFFDETVWAVRLRQFAKLSWASFDTTHLGYPTLYLALGGIGSWLLGLFGVDAQGGAAAIGWMRTLAATAGVLAVAVAGRTGAAMYGPWVGVGAAALLAVAPLDVMQVHYTSVEPLLVLCTVCVLAASWRLARTGAIGAAALAGGAAGLATGTKYTGLAFASTVAWAIGERWWRERALAPALRRAVVAGVALVAAFVLACPSCAVHVDALLGMLDRHRQMAAFGGFAGACLVPELGWWHRPWVYELVAGVPYAFGLPAALAAAGGVGVALVRRTMADRLVLAMLLPYFAYMGASPTVYPRYLLPLLPGLALLATAGLARALRPRVAAGLAIALIAYGGASSVTQLARFSWRQQTTVAEWLGSRIDGLAPADRLVVVPGDLNADPYFLLKKPITAAGYRVEVRRTGTWMHGRPAFIVVPEWLAMVLRRDGKQPLDTLTLAALERGDAGYRAVLRVPIADYLQRRWDTWWDPTFAIELWQGSIGFTVYARNDVAPDVRTPEVLASR